MKQKTLPPARVRRILATARKARTLVVGDAMLDHFIWGQVGRISPEAPVPVLEFERESFIPGGAANVARNLTALNLPTELFGVIGRDLAGAQLKRLLRKNKIGCDGLIADPERRTSVKTRIVAHQQQVVRVDRETKAPADGPAGDRLLAALESRLTGAAAVIVGDYGKGTITQSLLDEI
jgi:rfaE bifunctional protein kinase chain/domain